MKLRHIIIIALFVLINVLVFSTLNFKKPDKEKVEITEFVQVLEAAIVHNKTEKFQVAGYGTVTSFNSTDIACEVQGVLNASRKKLKPGVKFKKGELLFSVDDTEAKFNLRSRISGFINILAQLLPDIKVDFSSEFDKWNDYIASIEVDKRLPDLPEWKNDKEKIFLSTRNVISEFYTIKSMEEKLSKYRVHAPFTGVITNAFVSDKSVISPGTKVITFAQTDNFEVAVSIPAHTLGSVEVGTKASIFTTSGDQKGVGEVVRISEVINKSTQAIDVYIKPKAMDDKKFIEGEYVQVKIDETGEFNGFRLPSDAIDNNKVFVYSKTDSTLTEKDVIVLDENEKGIFASGLSDDQIVITQEVRNYTSSTKYDVLIKKQ